MREVPYLLGRRTSCRSGRLRRRPRASCPWCRGAAPRASSRCVYKLVPLFLRLTWPLATGGCKRVQVRPCNWNWWAGRRGRCGAKSQWCLPGRLELATLKMPSTSASKCTCRDVGVWAALACSRAWRSECATQCGAGIQGSAAQDIPNTSIHSLLSSLFVLLHIRPWQPQSHDRDVSSPRPH